MQQRELWQRSLFIKWRDSVTVSVIVTVTTSLHPDATGPCDIFEILSKDFLGCCSPDSGVCLIMKGKKA